MLLDKCCFFTSSAAPEINSFLAKHISFSTWGFIVYFSRFDQTLDPPLSGDGEVGSRDSEVGVCFPPSQASAVP